MSRAPHRAGAVLAAGLVLLLLAIDRRPRFMLGDSISYLEAGRFGVASLPPDRSWIFGLYLRGLLLATHGFLAAMVVELAALCLFVLVAGRVFLAGRAAAPALAVFALAIALDPLVETYARFSMSDEPAALLFVGFVCALAARLSRAGPLGVAAVVAFGAGAIAFRVAYAPVEFVTVTLAAAVSWRRGARAALRPLGAALLVPVLGVLLLAQVNAAVFNTRFGDGPFVTRLGGVFLMGVFSPALTAPDMRAAGVPVSAREVAAMRLTDANRISQVWGTQAWWLRRVVERKLRATGEYDGRVDAAARRMVVAAAEHRPGALLAVYGRGLGAQFSPAAWQQHLPSELGMGRRLDGWFVADLDQHLARPISPDATLTLSPVPTLLRAVIGAYPVLLLAGLVAAVAMLLVSAPAREHLLASGVVASFVVTPLYANYVIPRYLLASVMLTLLLLPIAVLRLIERRRSRVRSD